MPDKPPNTPSPPPSSARPTAAHSSSSQPSSDTSAEASTSLTASTADYVHLSKEVSRQSTPFSDLPHPNQFTHPEPAHRNSGDEEEEEEEEEEDEEEQNHSGSSEFSPILREEAADMPSDLRHSEDDKAHWRDPLLAHDRSRHSYDRPHASGGGISSRRSSFKERDPEEHADHTTRKRYLYAAGFLLVSLVSFAVQTETAVYIQHTLHWNKAYCMMYVLTNHRLKSTMRTERRSKGRTQF